MEVKELASLRDFQSIFAASPSFASGMANNKSAVQLLLCMDDTDDVSKQDCSALLSAVLDKLGDCRDRLSSFGLWNCTRYPDARATLGKEDRQPLLLVIHKGRVADLLPVSCPPTPLLVENGVLSRFCERLCGGQELFAVIDNERQSVNVAHLIDLGCRTMQQGKAMYAHKIFVKAVALLDAVHSDALANSTMDALCDYYSSLSLSLAWSGMSEMVMGRGVHQNVWLDRLRATPVLRASLEVPLSDALRAVTLQALLQSLGEEGAWRGDEPSCSQKHLVAHLHQEPADALSRRKLLVTIFLSGDLERSLTEALKLVSVSDAYGVEALRYIKAFCGPGHPLVEALGAPEDPL